MNLSENIAIIKRSIRYLYRLEKTYAVLLPLTAGLSALTPFVPVYISALILDELISGRRPAALALYAGLAVGLTFALHALNAALGKLLEAHEESLYMSESKAFAEKTVALDYADVENSEVHLLRERIKNESQTGYDLYYLLEGVKSFTSSAVTIVSSIGVSVSLFASPAVSLRAKLLLAAAVVAAEAVSFFTVSRKNKIDLRFFDECVLLNGLGNYYDEYYQDYKSGIEVRMYGMEELAASTLRGYSEHTNALMMKAAKEKLWYGAASSLARHGLQILVYALVISACIDGGITVGSIVKYVSCVFLLLSGLDELLKTAQIALQNNKYLKEYFRFFDIPSKMYQGTLPVEKRAFCAGGDNDYEIEFRGAYFRYPGAESYALRDLSLKLRIGERLAVVGLNGSGKTTFIKLLCRLYDPTEGEILLNGVDIRKYDYEEYMSLFAVVFQDFKLFAFALGQNVAACVNCDRARAERSLAEAGFGERLKELPKGLDTPLYKNFDKDGVEISGGEAQKIALARAIYRDAPFIVLDEPTAALDPIAEAGIYERFNETVGDKTAIYISHRLSSCRFCDDIAVFDGGEIVQRGPHERLLAVGGRYAELCNAQALYYR